jgi:hypothetical protein
MKALFTQKALCSSNPILPQAAFPALPARGGAAGRLPPGTHVLTAEAADSGGARGSAQVTIPAH